MIHRSDYTPPSWLIDTVELNIDIHNDYTLVNARLACRINPAVSGRQALILDGEELETLKLKLDQRELGAADYRIENNRLTLNDLPDAFTLETQVRIHPETNTHLSGLYRSQNGFFTQCEAQGFRRITWFMDRPDIMACYTVTIQAERDAFPTLLSNGHRIAQGEIGAGRHWATWQDPFKKPCYLFALVAAKLDVLHDEFVTRSGRRVELGVYVEPGKLDQSAHAMSALKKSMEWDEKAFGLECDLDNYMIVAVGDFNSGAMENKGLNIFNTRYVLARPDTATDTDFINIDRVVAHEYFHNWTGNRVTCRDWFQLSLKEGLTVFRDQEFGADVHNRATSRIQEVRGLRAAQFPEDAGPMAHPVRPDSYVEIGNFYTATVYEKGAEVVRMIRTLIGHDSFLRGMQVYFSRHDGQAVTCDDFVAAMADASGFDFAPFMPWYAEPGTPRIVARGDYDAANRRYTLHLQQSCEALQRRQAPRLIPVAVGLVGPDGEDFPLRLADDPTSTQPSATRLLLLREAEQSFVFEAIPAQPTPSLLRDFSAPAILIGDSSDADLAHLLAHDSDPFNRWEAGQQLFNRLILRATADLAQGKSIAWPDSLRASLARLLQHPDPAFIAEALTLPSEATLAEHMAVVDPESLFQARLSLSRHIAASLESELAALYRQLEDTGEYRIDAAAIARRRLRNLCLSYLNEIDAPHDYLSAAQRQFDNANNMSDQFAALSILVNTSDTAGATALEAFYQRWQHDALVVDKWLGVQATCRRNDTQRKVEALTRHPAFDLKNPNKVYALLRSFGSNHRNFHTADGSGYRFLAAQIAQLDALNPQIAARLTRCFDRWRKFDAVRQGHAEAALQQLAQRPGVSSEVGEIIARSFA